MPGPGGGGHGMVGRGEAEKSKDFSKSIKRLIKELKPFYFLIFIGIFFATAGSIISIVVPNLLSDLTNEITYGLATSINFDAVASIALTIGGLQIASLISEIIEGFTMTDVANKFARELRKRISKKNQSLAAPLFRQASDW